MKRKRSKKRARILIVDDRPAVREALASRIGRQPDLKVCGEAADMSEALRLVVDTRLDTIIQSTASAKRIKHGQERRKP